MITLNTPGARTLADATRWTIDGKGVYVVFSEDVAELHMRGTVVDVRPAAEITGTAAAQDWAVEFLAAELAAYTELVEIEQAAVAAHMEEVAALSPQVARVREQGAAMMAEADEMDTEGTEDIRVPRLRNGEQRGWFTIGATDPRHPARAAATLRQRALRLLMWTQADEDGFGSYVNESIGDTDGYFAPLARTAWAVSR